MNGKSLRIFKLSLFGLEISFRFIYFLFALVLIILLTYLFGFHILVGGLKGGDAGHAYHNLYWFARWFPKIPIWYPVQGGGFAFAINYSLLSIIFSILLNRASTFDLNQSLRLVAFASYFVAALGIYVFAAWRMRNQTLGIIASFIFLAIPGPWFWITKLGYYAHGFATWSIPWVIIFFDWFLENLLKDEAITLKTVISCFLAALFLGLAFNSHGMTAAPLTASLFIYGPVVGLLRQKRLIRGMLTGFSAALITTLACVGLYAFWFFPVVNYAKLASLGGSQDVPSDLILRAADVQNPQRILLDWSAKPITDQFYMPSFPRIVSYLIIFGFASTLVVSFIKKIFLKKEDFSATNKILGLSIVGFFFLIWIGLPLYLDRGLLEKLRFIYSYLTYRSISIPYTLLPLVAAFAIFAFAWIISEIPLLPFYLIGKRRNILVRYVKAALAGILSVCIFLNLLFIFEKGLDGADFYGWGPMDDPVYQEKVDYGYNGFYFRPNQDRLSIGSNIFSYRYYESLIKDSFAYSALSKMLGSPSPVSNVAYGLESSIRKVQSQMQLDQFTRVGLTGAIGAALQEWNTFTDASTLNQFHFQGSLFQSIRGFAETVFFGPDTGNHQPKLLSDLARYLGYRYVVTQPGVSADDTKHYLPVDWREITSEGGLTIYEFKDNQGMTTITSRPVVLVISTNDGYESVFRSAASGVIPYANAWLVQGGDRLDKYSLSDLVKFDGIILYGYNYKNRSKAFSVLDDYIAGGGRVFIDTGWQFVSADWQLEDAPAFLPVESLEWSSNLPPGEYALDANQASSLGVDKMTFEWVGQSWGLSAGNGLRNWARPLLAVNGKTIVAEGDYGKGKIIWSGLNLFGYLSYNKYTSDLIKFGNSIFLELFPEDFSQEAAPPIILKREFPDRVEINIKSPVSENARILWREPYTPNWRATLESGKRVKLSTYRAGPGFLLVSLPETKGATTLILEYKLGWEYTLGILVSVLSVFLFLGLTLDQIFYKGRIINKLAGSLGSYLPKNMKLNLDKILGEEE